MNPMSQISPSDVHVGGLPAPAEARTLEAVLARLLPLPSSALFVGRAEDGLPVLLNLRDPSPSPILIAADAGAGKTRLLKTIARGIQLVHDPERVRYAVVTAHPQEWSGFENSSHCDAILGFHHALTTGYVHGAALCDQSAGPRCSLVLMLDGLEALASDADLRDASQALLRQPPPLGVMPLVTLNTSAAPVASSWLDVFRTRLYGYIRDSRIGTELTCAPASLTSDLQPPCQFLAREEIAWLRFWLPDIE